MFVLDETQIRVVLLDIEGTTTPIDFVYKTLFPYASRKLESFLHANLKTTEIRALIEDLREQNDLDESQKLRPPVWHNDSEESRLHSSVTYAQWLMVQDSKCTALKTLQGKIWQEGFANGELHGEVYPDVPHAFERWRGQGREIAIYSSGSVLAQQNLFRTTTHGDLTTNIRDFFDTHAGIKSDPESYRKIAASLRRNPREILFLSDAAKEIHAARSAELQAILCDRAEFQDASAETIHTFDYIFPG